MRPVGVLTDRDIVVSVVAPETDPRALTVADVMTQQPATVRENEPLEQAVREMRRIGVRRLPVVGHRGELVGIISLDDVLNLVAMEIQDIAGTVVNERRIENATRA
jgi:CBS domain-containing protein